MNYSSVVITLSAGPDAPSLERISRLNGVEIHYVDEPSRRAVCVIEAQSTALEIDRFEELRRIPGVVDVSLVNHWFEEEA